MEQDRIQRRLIDLDVEIVTTHAIGSADRGSRPGGLHLQRRESVSWPATRW